MLLENPLSRRPILKVLYCHFFRFFHLSSELLDFLFNIKYLLTPESKSYSLGFFLLNQRLDKLEELSNSTENSNSIIEFLKKYFVFALFLLTKFFDWYFQPANNVQNNPDLDNKLVKPPYKSDQGISQSSSTFNYCQLCNKEFRNPTCLSVSGYVFCYTCIEEYVKRHGKCPISQLSCSLQSLHKIYKN